MTSLEFIRKKISKKIKTINEKRNFMANCKIMNIPFNSNLTYEDEKELEYLRQVESELEAWEVLKKHKTTIFAWVPFKSEEREIFKKALEVSND